MATLKGSTIASTYDSLVKRADTYAQTGTNIELMDDSAVIKPTGLYLESGATTDFVGIGVADPDTALEIFDTTTQLKLSFDATDFCTFGVDTNHDLTITPSSTGQIKLKPTTDSVDFFQVLDADAGTPILNVDSANERVGIGTAAPAADFEVVGQQQITGTDHNKLSLYGVNSGGNKAAFISYYPDETRRAYIGFGTDDTEYFSIVNEYSGSEKSVVISATGTVGIGEAAPTSMLHIKTAAADAGVHALFVECTEPAVDDGDVMMRLDWSADVDIHTGITAKFISCHDGQTNEIGFLTTDADGSLEDTFTDPSDIRLKENIRDASLKGLDIINGLKLRDFTWKDRINKDGEKRKSINKFVADEVYEIYPLATTGKPGAMKDVKDDDGNKTGEEEIDPMGVTIGKFISPMIKAIQELSAKVEALENA